MERPYDYISKTKTVVVDDVNTGLRLLRDQSQTKNFRELLETWFSDHHSLDGEGTPTMITEQYKKAVADYVDGTNK